MEKGQIKEETARMANLYEKGLSLRQIGDTFYLTKQAVHQRLQKAGIIRRNRGIESKAEKIDKVALERLYASYKTIAEIAEHFEVSPPTIIRALEFHGIPKRRRRGKWTDLLKSMEIGESRVIECDSVRPYTSLHTSAKRKGFKISVKKLGNNQFRITRQS